MDIKETVGDLNTTAKEKWKTLLSLSIGIIIAGILIALVIPKGASEFQKKESDRLTNIEIIYRGVMSSGKEDSGRQK